MVIDASVLVAALVDTGTDGAWCEAVIGDGALLAPELVLVETTNVLRRLERARLVAPPAATAAVDAALALDLELLAFEPFAARVWALRGNLTSYDACYVAVAEAAGEPLATLDLKLARAAAGCCQMLVPPPAR